MSTPSCIKCLSIAFLGALENKQDELDLDPRHIWTSAELMLVAVTARGYVVDDITASCEHRMPLPAAPLAERTNSVGTRSVACWTLVKQLVDAGAVEYAEVVPVDSCTVQVGTERWSFTEAGVEYRCTDPELQFTHYSRADDADELVAAALGFVSEGN